MLLRLTALLAHSRPLLSLGSSVREGWWLENSIALGGDHHDCSAKPAEQAAVQHFTWPSHVRTLAVGHDGVVVPTSEKRLSTRGVTGKRSPIHRRTVRAKRCENPGRDCGDWSHKARPAERAGRGGGGHRTGPGAAGRTEFPEPAEPELQHAQRADGRHRDDARIRQLFDPRPGHQQLDSLDRPDRRRLHRRRVHGRQRRHDRGQLRSARHRGVARPARRAVRSQRDRRRGVDQYPAAH